MVILNLIAKIEWCFVFVALSLLSIITSNLDSQNGFNLILQKLPILLVV